MLGLYKGLVPPLLAVGFQNAVLFGVYGNILNTLSPKQSQKASLAHISIAGAVSGAAQVVVICPLDLVKIKLQMQMDCKLPLDLSIPAVDTMKPRTLNWLPIAP